MLINDSRTMASQGSVRDMQSLLNEHRENNIHKKQEPELQRVVDELTNLSFANIADLFESQEFREQCGCDADGEPMYHTVNRIRLKDLAELPSELTACVKSVKNKVERGGEIVEVKMYDKVSSLEKLMRYHGGYSETSNINKSPANSLLNLVFDSVAASGLPTPKCQMPYRVSNYLRSKTGIQARVKLRSKVIG